MSSPILYEIEDDDDNDDADFQLDLEHAQTDGSLSDAPLDDANPSLSDTEPSQTIRTARRGITRDLELHDLKLAFARKSIDAYADILSKTIEGHAPVVVNAGGDNYNATQDGVVTWTPKEKEALYNALDRKGRDGIPEISRQIGTKSELEVQEHLRLLHKGLERQHLQERHTRTIVLGDVPAAAEISSRCCDALDTHAKIAALQEQETHDAVGKQKHQDLWIIDERIAKDLGHQTKAHGVDPSARSSAHVTAGLLNMKNWIRLSDRCFMNFGGARLEDNWVNVAYAGETPSMTADAFADFYALTVSITRRLVQSALFFASSRLRNMRETGRHKANVVKARDVETALNVLNMERDGSDFWVGVARRFCLKVKDYRHRKGWDAVDLEYDEVEEILSGIITFDPETGERSISPKRSLSRAPEDAEETAYSSDNESKMPSPPSSPLSSPIVSGDEQKQSLVTEDDHAEFVDQKMSQLEEAELWTLIGQSPPRSLAADIRKSESQDSHQKKPIGERKTKEEMADWRDRIFHRTEWEEYGSGLADLDEDLSGHRQKRRRLGQDSSRFVSVGHGKASGSAAERNSSVVLAHDEEEFDSAAEQIDSPGAHRPVLDRAMSVAETIPERYSIQPGTPEDEEFHSAAEQADGPAHHHRHSSELVDEVDADSHSTASQTDSPSHHDRHSSELMDEVEAGSDSAASQTSRPSTDHDSPDEWNEDAMSVDEPTPARHSIQATPEESQRDESPTSELASRLIRHLEDGQSGSWRTPRYADEDTDSEVISTPTRTMTRRRSVRLANKASSVSANSPSKRARSDSDEDYEDEVPSYSHGVSPLLASDASD